MTQTVSEQIAATAAAFDSVAATYDGPQGNNQLIQRMRDIVWERITGLLETPSTLLDLGCGTGIDALHFADLGHDVIATDVSPAMVARASQRTVEGNGRIATFPVGAHDLDVCEIPAGSVDLTYSNFGPLNCVPDLGHVARSAAVLVRPGGYAVFTVMGRWCPWEMAHYGRRRRGSRIAVRFKRHTTPVGMNGHTIWTRYFTPSEFVREWSGDADEWDVEYYQSLSLFVPPPYLDALARRRPRLFQRLVAMDRRTARWPLLRGMGDHFLVVMRRR
jgi:SAM-dependent methyltransferase